MVQFVPTLIVHSLHHRGDGRQERGQEKDACDQGHCERHPKDKDLKPMMTSDQRRNLITPRIGEGNGHQCRCSGEKDREKQKAVGQISEVAVHADI
ncbi:MAG: hypothetical protein RLZZ141_840 [Pseudomonadota bacterium]